MAEPRELSPSLTCGGSHGRLDEGYRLQAQAGAEIACFSYIEGWYNPVRLHSALCYRSPMACEATMQTAEADT